MTKRERVVLSLTLVALGVSIALFAWSSLARFLQNKGREPVPVVGSITIQIPKHEALLSQEIVQPTVTPKQNAGAELAPLTANAHQDKNCTKKVIPFKTRYEKTSSGEKEDVVSSNSRDGYNETCYDQKTNERVETVIRSEDRVVLTSVEHSLRTLLSTLFSR